MLRFSPCIATASFILLFLNLLAFQFVYMYREDPFTVLTSPVSSGPFKGLYTTAKRQSYLESFQRRISKIDEEHEAIIFYPDFPAGVLMTKSRLGVCTTWLTALGSETTLYQSYFTPCFNRLRGENANIIIFLACSTSHQLPWDCLSRNHFLYRSLKEGKVVSGQFNYKVIRTHFPEIATP